MVIYEQKGARKSANYEARFADFRIYFVYLRYLFSAKILNFQTTQFMKRYIIRIFAVVSIFWLGGKVAQWNEKHQQCGSADGCDYKAKIENNTLMPKVDSMAKAVVATGFSAGAGYGEDRIYQ